MRLGSLSNFPGLGRSLGLMFVLVFVLLAAMNDAKAQESLVIRAPAVGGGGDRLARAMAAGLSSATGRRAVVLNAQNSANVAGFGDDRPDGNTLLFAHLRGSGGSPPGTHVAQFAGLVPIALVGSESLVYGVFAPTGTQAGLAASLERDVVKALTGDPVRSLLDAMKGRVAGAVALREFVAAGFVWPAPSTPPTPAAGAVKAPAPASAQALAVAPPTAPGVAPQKPAKSGDVVSITVTSHPGGPGHALARKIGESLARARGGRAEVEGQLLGGGIVAAESFLGASPGDTRLLMITLESPTGGISPLARAGALDRFVPLATLRVGDTRYGVFAPGGTPTDLAQALEQGVGSAATAAGAQGAMAGSASLRSALAAAKTARAGAGPNAVLADKGKAVPRQRTGREYSSICVRNLMKADAALIRAGANEYSFDLPMMRTANAALIELARPCAANDGEAAAYVKDLESALAKKIEFCSQANMASHASCVSMTAQSRRRMEALLAETKKARNDPNYSADLGWIKGEAAPTVTVGDLTERYCLAELKQAEATAQAALDALRNKPGSVEPAEVSLWLIDRKLRLAGNLCQEPSRLRAELERDRGKYKEIEATCNKVAVRPCTPRLPETATAASPPPSASPPKPLRTDKPLDCGKLSGTNRISCWKQECADAKGQVELNGQCVHCDIPGSRWIKCLDGVGAAQ